MDPVINSLLNLGIGGCMAAAVLWVVYYSMTNMIPRMVDRFAQELQAEREGCERRHQESMGAHRLTHEGQKEIRHGLKDLANAVELRKALERLRDEGQHP